MHANKDDFEVSITGEWTYDKDLVELSQHDLEKGELQFGLPVALIVLLIVFGAVVAGLVPMLLALISIAVALGVVAIISQFYDLSIFTVNMLSGMGLALGVDYALFVVSRFREERARGLEKQDAIEATGSTASRAVVFSGFAFALAMCGLLLVPDTIFRSLATGAIVVGVVSVIGGAHASARPPEPARRPDQRASDPHHRALGGVRLGHGRPLLVGDRPRCDAPPGARPGRLGRRSCSC